MKQIAQQGWVTLQNTTFPGFMYWWTQKMTRCSVYFRGEHIAGWVEWNRECSAEAQGNGSNLKSKWFIKWKIRQFLEALSMMCSFQCIVFQWHLCMPGQGRGGPIHWSGGQPGGDPRWGCKMHFSGSDILSNELSLHCVFPNLCREYTARTSLNATLKKISIWSITENPVR